LFKAFLGTVSWMWPYERQNMPTTLLHAPWIFRPSYGPTVRYVGEIGMGKPLFSLDLSECPAMNATAIATTNARLGRARQAGNSGL
jgi:hypothetical protein